jgi:heptosyltransferase-2
MIRANRVLIVSPNWLGDAVMALPAVNDIRRAFPDASVHVAARASIAPLYAMVPGIDETVTLPGRGGWSALLSWRREAAVLANRGYEAAVLLPNSFASALIVRRAGIPERWGFAADGRRRLLTRGVPKPGVRGHQAAYYQALVNALGMPVGELIARVEVPAAARDRARALLDSTRSGGRPFVVLAPGAAYGRAKQWPPERFAELARLLVAEDVAAVLVGSGADRSVCAEIARLARPGDRQRAEPSGPAASASVDRRAPGVIDLSGQTDLSTLAGVLSLSRACVSNDSGAMHLAAAVGGRVVAVFGSTNEHRTSPLRAGPDAPPARILHADVWCRPCMLRECPIDHRCMTGISAAEVMTALRFE